MEEETVKIAYGYNINEFEIGLIMNKKGLNRYEAIKIAISEYKQRIEESIITSIKAQELIEYKVVKKNNTNTVEGYISLGMQTIPDYWVETQTILNKYDIVLQSRNTQDDILLRSPKINTIDVSDKEILRELGWTVSEELIERPKRKDTII